MGSRINCHYCRKPSPTREVDETKELRKNLVMTCAKKFMIKQEYYDLKQINSILFN